MSVKNRSKQRFWTDWKIGGKVIGLILAIVAMVTVALVLVNYFLNMTQTTKNVGEQLLTLGDNVVLRAADQVFGEIDVLETLARTPSLVDAIKQANLDRSELSEAEIADMDQKWIDKDASMNALVNEISANELTSYLRDFMSINPEQVEVFVTDKEGLVVAMTTRTSDFRQSDEGWWQSAYADGAGNSYIADVEFDESANSYAMNLGIPIYDPQTKKAIGVLRGTLDVSSLITTLGDVKIGETGYASLIDVNGNILYTSNPALIMQPASQELMQLFESGDSGWTKALNLDGKQAVLAYSQLSGERAEKLHWNMLMSQEESEVRAAILRSLFISVGAALLVVILGVVIGTVVTRTISLPLTKITKVFNQLSGGNLNLDASDLSLLEKVRNNHDEVGELATSGFNLVDYQKDMVGVAQKIAEGDLGVKVNVRSSEDQMGNAIAQMTNNLIGLVSQVTEGAKNVGTSSAGLAEAAKQAARATEQISTSIQQMAQGTSEFANTINRTTQSVEQMSIAIDGVANGAQDQAQAVGQATVIAAQITNTIHEIADNAKSSAQAANEAAETARTGAQIVDETIVGMNSIKEKVGISVEKVQEMGDRSAQIGTIVQTIEEISSQTNLLALNAAIEAARAGEHGKGFAVVADEVRKLAERSSDATREISGLIGGIQNSVAEAVAAMNDGALEVETGVSRAGQSGVALESILKAVESVNAQVSSIADAATSINDSAVELDNSMGSVSAVVEENTAATEEMSASSSEVNSAMEVIAAGSEETSASIQEVSASTEEMAAQVQEVTASADMLASLAEALRIAVNRFKLNQDDKEIN